ncbi:MAG: hypothetical protein A3C04_03795 [Candidatus Wildermuthbacteria bacterium RIFCSPHIGHO2_02_FULL_45_25]|uniref:Pseudouridine synthase RsuA/RluA-like domain-containing protein n=1 Tax=Candidatus Wildermuthbacteria bacterium RIFCSPHIGHO2_02_FULL_45_25 TaxID=1802450 RepID=A0A1G2R580_9BACT|nr:MAG: hypothetical protein A3C04_03795 [Candidatus Wildermuthbacteria bacterium RIFCSPHIGHO2_02_FULL_45_25]
MIQPSLQIILEDGILIVIDKPAGLPVWLENQEQTTVGSLLAERFPNQKQLGNERRYGIIHRLDKDTSGVLLVAKTAEAFDFFQKQFAERKVEKQYICLAAGSIKQEKGTIHTLMSRSPSDRRKQKASPWSENIPPGSREATTEFELRGRYEDKKGNKYTLVKAFPKTGRKHQIRAHMAFLGNPLAGDKLYQFKNQPTPEGLQRQFLHASSLKVPYPDGTIKEFTAELPADLKETLAKLNPISH